MTQLESLLRASLNLHSSELEQQARGLTLDDARRMLVRIGSAAERGEIDSARIDERELFLKALRAIAAGHRDAQRLASIAILTTQLHFDREGT